MNFSLSLIRSPLDFYASPSFVTAHTVVSTNLTNLFSLALIPPKKLFDSKPRESKWGRCEIELLDRSRSLCSFDLIQ